MRVSPELFDRPSGTSTSFATIPQHFVLGYFRRVPPGQFAAYTLSLMLSAWAVAGLKFASRRKIRFNPFSARRNFEQPVESARDFDIRSASYPWHCLQVRQAAIEIDLTNDRSCSTG